MLPLGLLLFAQDVPPLRKPMAHGLGWIERKWLERQRAKLERERAAAAAAIANGEVTSSGWARPASGGITDGYGPRTSICTPGNGCSNSFHYAYDIGTGCGAPIYAASSGVVSFAGYSGQYGNYVMVNHGGGVQTAYAHNSSLLVSSGQSVAAGEQIAWSGRTGLVTGCHSHFEVWRGGGRIDPGPFMADRGVYFG
jgi:murein DD-endopeptidase MepM/ murein hydrolase activator NlpD